MGIKDWWIRHRVDGPDPTQYDEAIEQDRHQACQDLQQAQDEVAEVRRLEPRSDNVHRGLAKWREDNHFAPKLLRVLKEGPR